MPTSTQHQHNTNTTVIAMPQLTGNIASPMDMHADACIIKLVAFISQALAGVKNTCQIKPPLMAVGNQ
jgi:hypothetical protein